MTPSPASAVASVEGVLSHRWAQMHTDSKTPGPASAVASVEGGY